MASSWTLRQSRLRDGAAVLSAEGRGVEREEEAAWREESSAGVGARRTIFLNWRVVRWRNGEKGGLRMPSFGVIMNFWFSGGMERLVWMVVERSVRVDDGVKAKVWGVPWWVMVMLMEASSDECRGFGDCGGI